MRKHVIELGVAVLVALAGLIGQSLVNVNVSFGKGETARREEGAYEVRRVPCTVYVTRRTACGQAYQEATTVYRTVQVPMRRTGPGCP